MSRFGRVASWAANNVGLILTVVVGFALMMIVLGVQDCHSDKKAREAAMENIRLRAALGETRQYSDAVSGRLSFLGESLGMELEEARRVRDSLEQTLVATTRVNVRLRARVRDFEGSFETDTIGVGGSTFIPVPEQIDPFRLSGGATLEGHQLPDGVRVVWDLSVEVPELDLAVDITQDPETCAVEIHVTALDPAVEVNDIRAAVEDRIVELCLERDNRNPWFWAAVAEAAVLGILLLGGR